MSTQSEITIAQIAHLSAENSHLRERLQYAYSRIHYGFVYGDFDLSVLRNEAREWLATTDVAV
jgi:hypothetical protein